MKQASQLLLLAFLGLIALMPWYAVLVMGLLAPILAVFFLLYCAYAWLRFALFHS